MNKKERASRVELGKNLTIEKLMTKKRDHPVRAGCDVIGLHGCPYIYRYVCGPQAANSSLKYFIVLVTQICLPFGDSKILFVSVAETLSSFPCNRVNRCISFSDN